MSHLSSASISRIVLRAASVALTFATLLGAFGAPSVQAQTLTVLYKFRGNSDIFPQAGLLRDPAGNLYGTTSGTACTSYSNEYGAMFKVDRRGSQTVLHTFNFTDGSCPESQLIEDEEGNLYGTTLEGGTMGDGTVFKFDLKGNETVLYSFTGGPADGFYPVAGLLRDKAGNLYGTTWYGGPSEYGAVFKLDTNGAETILHTFSGADGRFPSSGLIMDADGNLYGVTAMGGGPGCSGYGCGTVYKIDKNGAVALLHRFVGGGDGCFPAGTLVIDQKGNLYGTTQDCGASGAGTVFKLDASRRATTLHSFAGGTKDGSEPNAGVIMDSGGNLYGDTVTGGGTGCGGYGCGTVYKLNTKGTLTLLHSFSGPDGEFPYSGLIRDPNGTLYGTASQGGRGCQGTGCGTVWKLTP